MNIQKGFSNKGELKKIERGKHYGLCVATLHGKVKTFYQCICCYFKCRLFFVLYHISTGMNCYLKKSKVNVFL